MERRISTFLEEKGFDIKRRRKGQTIVDTLKDFFESENCINVNDAEDTINLHFDVFNKYYLCSRSQMKFLAKTMGT